MQPKELPPTTSTGEERIPDLSVEDFIIFSIIRHAPESSKFTLSTSGKTIEFAGQQSSLPRP